MRQFEVVDDQDDVIGRWSSLQNARAAARKLTDGYAIYRGYWTRGIYGEAPEFVCEERVEWSEGRPDDPRAAQAAGFPPIGDENDDTPCLEFPAP